MLYRGRRNGSVPEAATNGGPATSAAGVRHRPNVPLAVLAALLLLTAAFGREFSKIELGGVSWLHPTELGLLVIALAPLVGGGISNWVRRLRASRVLVPLLVLWFFGAIATLRGLQDWGFSLVLHDIGLVEYSALVPLVFLVVRDRADFFWLCRVIAIGGLLAVAVQAATYWTPLEWELGTRLDLIAIASGMYACIYVAWVAARLASRRSFGRWHYLAFVLAVAVTVIGASRAAWLALIGACVIAIMMASSGRRLVTAGIVGALLAVGILLAGPAAKIQIGHPPVVAAPAPTTEGGTESATAPSTGSGTSGETATSLPPTEDPAPVAGATQVTSEIGASFDFAQAEGANARWRLDFWTFLLRQTAHSPLLGVGFGTPSSFVWSGIPYDSRTGNPLDPFDVSGPHNSFLNLLYRTGAVALLALAVLMGLAAMRLISVSRRSVGEDRAIAIWLIAALAVTTIISGLAVALEGPFMGVFFWTVLGLALMAPEFLGQRPSARPRPTAVERGFGPSTNGRPSHSPTAA